MFDARPASSARSRPFGAARAAGVLYLAIIALGLTSELVFRGALVVPGNAECVAAALELQGHGFDVKAIRSPTVPVGTERIRIILHFHNSESEVEGLWDAIDDDSFDFDDDEDEDEDDNEKKDL